jgi:hypothetical protein
MSNYQYTTGPRMGEPESQQEMPEWSQISKPKKLHSATLYIDKKNLA